MPYIESRSCKRRIIGREQHAIGRVAMPYMESRCCRRGIIGRVQQALGTVQS